MPSAGVPGGGGAICPPGTGELGERGFEVESPARQLCSSQTPPKAKAPQVVKPARALVILVARRQDGVVVALVP
jgi:hypothetical protein